MAEEKPVSIEVPITAPEGTLSTTPSFASGFQLAVNESAVVVMFQRLNILSTGGETAIQPEIFNAVGMSHIMAKDIMNVLGEALAEFENTTGPIPSLGRFKDKG